VGVVDVNLVLACVVGHKGRRKKKKETHVSTTIYFLTSST
jgi:hypothetical protein